MNNTERQDLVKENFTTTIVVNNSASDVVKAVKNFRGWWSEEIAGHTDQLNAIFFYHYKDIHLCRMRLIEEITNKRIVYEVVENEFKFTSDKSEWVNTKLVFDIVVNASNQTELRFTHVGLVPAYECYDVCSDAWTGYIQKSLKNFIEFGKGNPNPRDQDGFNAELAKKWGLV